MTGSETQAGTIEASVRETAAPNGERARQLLGSLELLDTLGDDALAALESQVRWLEVPAGVQVFDEGDPSDSVYFVAHGRLGILQRDGMGGTRLVREVGAGQPVGELGLLLDQARSASAVALRETLLVHLDRAGFERLIELQPAALLPLSRRIAQRLATREDGRTEATAAVTLVAPASSAVPLNELWHGLSKLLAIQGASCLTSVELAQALGDSKDIDPTRAARWLEERARGGQPVFVLSKSLRSTRALAPCVDRTLIVANAGGLRAIGPLEKRFTVLRERGVPAVLDLVLLQDSDTLPQDTSGWLEHVQPTRHHHVRLGVIDDIGRLARKLTGRAIGLALGGGGARAFAHIGAIRALQEFDVPIDVVSGTNIGAVIGAQLALGWDADHMLEVNEREWARVGSDVTVPFVSLLGGRSLRAVMRRLFGDLHIEDLWLDFRCATVDLSWSRLVTHRRGPLQQWLRASVSIPGLHPPVVSGGRLYVDGGLLDKVPSQSAREAGAGTLISVDPSPFRRQTVDERFEEAPTGLDFLLQRIPIIGSGFPSVVSLVYRAVFAAQQSRHSSHKSSSDLYIEPPVDRFSITDYSCVAEIAEFGYEETRRRLEREGPPDVAQ
jgi:NTE family protein